MSRYVDELAKRLSDRLWEVCGLDRNLKAWYGRHGWKIGAVAYYLAAESGSPERLAAEVNEVLGFLPRYVRLVEKSKDIRLSALMHLWDLTYRFLELLSSMKPLSSELRETGVAVDDGKVYVGDWIYVGRYRPSFEIEAVGAAPGALLKLFAEHGREIAEYVEDEEKREAFLRLVELVEQLKLPLDEVCEGVGPGRDVCASPLAPSVVMVSGKHEVRVHDPMDVLKVKEIADALERLYGKLERRLRRAAERSSSVLEEMRRVVRPYIVDRILG